MFICLCSIDYAISNWEPVFSFSWNMLFLDTKKTDRDPFSKDVGDKDFRKYYFGIDAQRSRLHSKILRRAWPKGEKVLLRVQIDAYK